MKRFIALLCALSLGLTMTACSQTGSSDNTLTGKVTAIDGTTVTLQLGELNEPDTTDSVPSDAQQPSGSGESSGSNDSGSGQTPPEMPSDNGESNDSGSGQTPPEKPSDSGDGNGSDSGQTPPEKPSGSTESGSGSGEAPSDLPSDSGSGQTPPDGNAPDGAGDMGFTAGDETSDIDIGSATIQVESGSETTEGSVDDIEVGSILVIETNSDGSAKTVTVKSVGGQPGGGSFGGSGEVTQGTAATTLEEDGEYSEESYSSTGDDENALRVDGASVTLDGITVDKSDGESSNTEDGDFYGMNAALLATDGAQVTIKNATVTSSAQNGNGVFSYGENTTVDISDSTITTTADNSGGIQTTGGGTTNASNLTVETSGSSSAAIRSDRGGGTVNVDGGTYTSNGYNSPAVYSTAAITVENATLTANNSEALVIEGQNSISLKNCDVTGNMSDDKGTSSDENVHNVMIYQSMSGDAEEGTSSFSMTGGSLTSENGDMFFLTNTSATIELSGVTIDNQDEDGYLLNISGNSGDRGWGTAGENGAQVEFTADDQELDGDIVVDSISTLNMTLSGNSSFTGTINIVDNEEGGEAVSDNAVVTVEEGSTWTLTGDCTLTSLTNNGTIDYNGHTITLADGTVLK